MHILCSSAHDIRNLRCHIYSYGIAAAIFNNRISALIRKIRQHYASVFKYKPLDFRHILEDGYLLANVITVAVTVHFADNMLIGIFSVYKQEPSRRIQPYVGFTGKICPQYYKCCLHKGQHHQGLRTYIEYSDQYNLYISDYIGYDNGRNVRENDISQPHICDFISVKCIRQQNQHQYIYSDKCPVSSSVEISVRMLIQHRCILHIPYISEADYLEQHGYCNCY